MKYTSAEANKLLKKLNDEVNAELFREARAKSFLAAVGENIEDVRPEYSYDDVRAHIDELNAKIRKVKHAINCFNIATEIPGFGMTIDEMLVYIPQLTRKKDTLGVMKDAFPKEREGNYNQSSIIDYRYANYDIEKAQVDYTAVADELSRAQTALDMVNSTVTFEIEI